MTGGSTLETCVTGETARTQGAGRPGVVGFGAGGAAAPAGQPDHFHSPFVFRSLTSPARPSQVAELPDATDPAF
jgi:hypothetical protein